MYFLLLFFVGGERKAHGNSNIFFFGRVPWSHHPPVPFRLLQSVPMMVHLMTAPADGDMSAMMKLSWRCGYKWNIAIFLHSCPALSPSTMKVGPSCRAHTPAHKYLLPAERVQGGVGVGAGGAAGGRGPLHPRHHGGGGHPHSHPPRPLQPHPDTDPLPHRRGAQYDTLTIYTVSTYLHPYLGLAAAGGLGALAVASSVLADGGGGGASGGYGYSAPAREGHSCVQDLCHEMS